MPTLLTKLAAYRPFTAMVVGDFMLDQEQFGAAERLSPDAPVPVLHHSHQVDRPGGAANVALALRALDGIVRCVGVVGDDPAGRVLRETLADAGCVIDGMLTDASRPTTVKRSFVGLAQHRHPQKMFRVDVESREPVSEAMVATLMNAVDLQLDGVDVVCLEDYAKGVCTTPLCQALIRRCRERGIPIIVDPAAIPSFQKYRGATAITPNRSEAELATGVDTPIDASAVHNAGLAAKLGRDLDLDAVVLTLDRHGALLEERGGEPVLVPTVARSVYDVTGAGDIVLAALAAGRANGFTWLEAVQFANAAAGLEVEVFGAQPIPLAHVQRAVLVAQRELAGKVRSCDELLVEVAVHRAAGHRIVFTNGCFDVIHAGHVGYLREARAQGDVLIVAVNGDEQVRAQKGAGRPVYELADRLDILAELQCVDYLVSFDEPTVATLLRSVRPDLYVKGGDYRPEEINEQDVLADLGVEVRVLGHRPGLGSTQVIEQINASRPPS
ncbi:MAG: bifunctional heptose 7-phosphate kinase/heptose 1-phosphate adenyltransferase [Phycisphaerales bacterium]|nr:bifunctional heptose 7-phosphate kinase/heptose 1-phosphate adenyltransferase [Phycisphaerales bacterium]NNM25940.1 bifunctional heptose 7-phosphate kinase/heptose 1-phosphate adenyltransferase [Phycisphaerales bacterium]